MAPEQHLPKRRLQIPDDEARDGHRPNMGEYSALPNTGPEISLPAWPG